MEKRSTRSIGKRSPVKAARRLHLHKETALPALSTLAVVLGSMVSGGVHANPTGGSVVAGSASIIDRGNGTLDINQSTGKAIINWKDFNIGKGETVNFRQPGGKSVTLNRVVGNDPSAIFGRLNANGTVMLVNPNGVVFGKGARIDVGGLVATTANIRDQDFLAGKYKFDQASPKLDAAVINEGTISIKDSGLAALVAPSVRNSGVIEARLGRVALAGARTFTVDFQGDGLLSFDASSAVEGLPKDADGKPAGALVSNTGEIRADGGTVLMTARAVKGVIDNVINTDGIVSAKAVGTKNGKIVLSGGDAGTVKVAGTVDATGKNAGERGGKVVVTGEHVDVVRGAAIDASGSAGGGEIALGSLGVAPDDGSAAFSGKSSTVKVAAGATLKADALVKGDGGDVTMWSNDATAFAGSLSARGGEQGGDGGFAEVSSKKNIGLTGSADLRAPKGKTGLLLIDPTDLRIIDAGAGALDGSAGDGTINGGDANAATNTVSRGLLESLAGTTNIKLEATGQITVAGDISLIDLQTAPGHSFTMRSTQTGGIRFENANTEISTQGGSITLEALGVGSTLDNIGKLTSRGGNITLNATGDINLANAIDAGSGVALVRTSAGTIRNTGGASQVVAGGSVTLDASGGSIGMPGNAVNTQTAHLSLATGGNLVVANRTALTSLDITSRHAQANVDNVFELSSVGLDFDVTDAGGYTLNRVRQSGLNFSFTGDRTITAGDISLGAGALALNSTSGHILGTSASRLSAGSIALSAAGSNGRNGAIGSFSQALNTQTASLTAASGTGGVYLNNAMSLALNSVDTTGSLFVTNAGQLTLGAIKAGASSTLRATAGSILDDGNDATIVATPSLTLSAEYGTIGTLARSLKTNASTLSATGATGVYLDSTSSLNITEAQSDGGSIAITSGGHITANNVGSGGGAINLTGNSISAGQVNAGAGNVTLTTRAGSITGNSASLITGSVVTLLAPAANSAYTVGTSGTALRTAAGELHATGGQVYIHQADGSVLLDDLTAYQGITVTGVADLTANMLNAGTGTLRLNAQGGSILRANASSVLAGNSVDLQAQRHIGTSGDHIETSTASLTLNSGGDIYVDNPDKALTHLSIANSHADTSRRNTLLVSAPFLEFDVNDDLGVAYELRNVYSSLLNQFVFRGDQDLKLGTIRAGSGVTLTSTQGNILDDGNANTRVTANSVGLSAYLDIGTSADFIAVNAPSLSADTRGNLYVTDIADLSSLTVYARHKADDDHYVLDVRAPSLLFDISDDASGHTIHQLRDSNWVNFSFYSDRDITAGSIDAGYAGTITLNTSGGIIDDGNKNTLLLANSVNLYAGRAVGAGGAGYMDILTSNLNGSAGSGMFNVRLPNPVGSGNYTGIITLGSITASDLVQIDAVQGDLVLGSMVRSNTGNVSLIARNGSIEGSGSVYSGAGFITLDAAGQIGGMYADTDRSVGVGGAGQVTVMATAGGEIYLNGGSSNIFLASLNAGGNVRHTQWSNTTTVGNVLSGGSVSITNDSGSIADDGNAATLIRGSSVALRAISGAIGAPAAVLTVQTSDLTLASGGNIAVHNTAGLDRLDITRHGAGSGAYWITAPNLTSFTISDDAGGLHLRDIASSTDLDFGFNGVNKNVLVGNIDTGANGTVRLASGLNIANDDPANRGAIRAATVSLTAGSSGSIGSAVAGGALALTGTSSLSLTSGNNVYVDSDTVLRSLSINSLRSAGLASNYAIGTAAGQTVRISDDGLTHYLEQITGGLTDFSFSGRKNILVGTIGASNSVSLTTANGGVNSSITSDGGAGRITADTVTLSATGSDSYTARDAKTGAIGLASGALRVSTSNLDIANNGDIYLNNGGLALSSLDLYLSRRDAGSTTNFDTNVYAIGGLGGQTLGISGGTNLSISANMAGADLSINADSGLTSNGISTGVAGTVALTSRYANSNVAPSIGGTGLITGGKVSLSALGTNGSVSAQTSTTDLSIASAGNVSVNNNISLNALSLTANHNRSGGSSSNTYAITASNLSAFSLSDSTGTSGLTLGDVRSSGNLALSISSDRTLTVSNVNTGAGGSVSLSTTGTIYGNSSSAASPNIITGALTLNANSVTGTYNTVRPLYVSVDSLSSNIRGSMWVSNNKSLTLLNNNVASSAEVNVTNGSIMQGAGAFVAPVLVLSATQSIGAAGNALLTDTRRLTTRTGGDLYVDNATDLFSLDIQANHANPAVDNVVQVAAQGLTFDITDTNGYNVTEIRDVTGLNFSFSGDRDVRVGTIDVGPAHSASLAATGAGSDIVNLAPGSHITADSVSLFANSEIGVDTADNLGSIHTTASELYLTAGSHVYVENHRDLATLSLYATGASPATYEILSNELLFDVSHNGSRLLVNEVRDNTGLNLMLSSSVGQDIGIIDTLPTGTVRLSSNGSILGSADSTQRITAAQVELVTQGTGGMGAVGRELNLSTPLLRIQNTGDVYIDSDTHIDSLSLDSRGNNARSYSIASPARDGGSIGFTATDDGSGSAAGLVLTNVQDAGGMALNVISDRSITVGTIDVGYDTVSLYARSGSLLGDGDSNTKIDAASLNLTAQQGAIGATGAGNAIDTRVSTVSGSAYGGGAYITVEGNTSLPSLYATGNSAVTNTVGDIELGTVNTNGNAFTANNAGGSILSGTISNATTVTLTANGSIGNKSAIRTTNISSGGTTVVTLSARKTDTADGSIALTEAFGLRAASVTADGDVTLTADFSGMGRDLVVGTISTTNGAVALSTSRGSIIGADNTNLITGKSVSLTADYGTSRSIGSSNANKLHLNTPQLTLATPGSIYVDNLADLTDLTIIRNNAQGSNFGSAGFLSIEAQNLVFSGGDSSNVSTLTTVSDSTGLNFDYRAIGAIALHTIDVTQTGSVSLATNPYTTSSGGIYGLNTFSKITADDLTLSAGWSNATNSIGSNGLYLNTQVNNIAATASGSIWLNQTGSINLGNLNAGDSLSVRTTTGDIIVGAVNYGTNGDSSSLTLNAQAGRILSGGGTISGYGDGAISLTARDGIGTSDAAIRISAPLNPVSATVTGTGSLYLDSTNNLMGGLTTSVNNGATRVTSSGNIVLAGMTSGTDAVGNDISVKTSSGSITVGNVQAGANHGQVTLNAENGYILARGAGATVKAYGVALNARDGIGADSATGRINASGQRVEATTNGSMYLAADNNAVYSYLSGSTIDIAAAGNLQIANAIATNGGGTIRMTGNGTNSQLVAGNIDAGTGSVTIDFGRAGSTIVDDREDATRIVGGSVTLTAGAGIGGATADSLDRVQTDAGSISARVTGNGAIYLDDNRAAGTTLNSVRTANGAIGITTAGPTRAVSVISETSNASNDIAIAVSHGDLTVDTVDGKVLGDVTLQAAGSILGGSAANLVTGRSLTASAGGSIGTVGDLPTGTGGQALRTNVASLGQLATAADGAVISIDNLGTTPLTLNGNVTQTGDHSSLYVRTAGALDASAGVPATADNLLLSAAGILTVAASGVQAANTVTLAGGVDIRAAGADPRTIIVEADTLNFVSGAAGGSTTLKTEVATISASLTGTTAAGNLTLDNTGDLDATLSTANGDISATASGMLRASSVTAAGANRTIDLTATDGDIEVGTVNAGATGAIILTAEQGSLMGGGSGLTANSLEMTAYTGIGSAGDRFATSVRNVSAEVLGTGDIYLGGTGPLTLAKLATHAGDIDVTASGALRSDTHITAGDGGVALASTAGVTLNGDITADAIDITGDVTLAGGTRTLNTSGAGGDIGINGTLNGGVQQAVFNAGAGDVTLSGNAANLAGLTIDGAAISVQGVATTGAQRYNGNTTLAGNSYTTISGGFTVDGATTLANGVTVWAGYGDVAFAGDVTGADHALTVTTTGDTRYEGTVDAAALANNGIGSVYLDGGAVTTAGSQTYVGHVTLGADTTLTGSSVTLNNGVDGAHGLTIVGAAGLTGNIGAADKLASLAIHGNATLATDSIATTGNQEYRGDLILVGAQSWTTTVGDVIVDGSLDSAHDLTVASTGAGDVTFGVIGSSAQRLGALAVDTAGATTFGGAVHAASVQTDVPGSVAINGGLVDTTGTQFYGELATFGADTVLTGTHVSLLGGGDGGHDLTIDGDATLQGDFGASDALGSLTINGSITLNEGSIATVGDQAYNGTVALAGLQELNTQGGDVSFTHKVASAGGHSLSVEAGAGNVTFEDAVGDDEGGRLGDITVRSNGATTLNGPVYAASVTTDEGGTIAIDGGLVDTIGTQSYGEIVLFGRDTVLTGTTVSLLGGGDGEHDLTIDGDAVLKGPFGSNEALASLTVNGNATLGAGSIATQGDQSYTGTVTLGGDVALASHEGDIVFDEAIDGSHDLSIVADQGDVLFAGPVGQGARLGDLTIAANGGTRFEGPVRAGSVQTSGAGDLVINGGSVDTTGEQRYGQHVVLGGVDTTLTGTTVQLGAGVDGTEWGQQGLIIVGNADIHGDVGAITALRGLTVEGDTAMGAGKVVTIGDQTYKGAVALTGDRDLGSSTGSVVFGSTLDGGNGSNLAISAGQDILVADDATGLGSLTLRAVDTIVFNGDVSAYRVEQLEARSASYNGSLTAAGPDGIALSGGGFSFGGDVTATTGAIKIANPGNTGTVDFAAGTTVRAATGFTQTGGSGVTLPANLLVTQGPISLGAPARLQGAAATISTNGDITAVGLSGPQTALTLSSGLGAMRIGLNDADPSHKLDVLSLSVPTAGSADMWGMIGGKGGALAAATVKSSLVGSPYFLNGTTWGPTDVIDRLAASTAPRWVAPTTPTADSLFRGTVMPQAYGPDVLGAYADPQVLTVADAGRAVWQRQSGDNALLQIPSGDGSVLQAPAGAPQQTGIGGAQPSDEPRRERDEQPRTL